MFYWLIIIPGFPLVYFICHVLKRSISFEIISKLRRFKTKVHGLLKTYVKGPPLYSFQPLTFNELCLSHSETVPAPRSGHKIVCDEGHLYSFGGYDTWTTFFQEMFVNPPFERLLKELWCYNYAADRWIQLKSTGDIPSGIVSHSMHLRGNFILIFGGAGIPFADTSTNVLWICDLRTLIWKAVTASDQTETPPPTYGQGMVVDDVGKVMYVIGGTQGFHYNIDVHKLDLKTLKWQKLYSTGSDLNEPNPRYRHDLVLDGQYIFIIGGGTAFTVCSLEIIPAFDLLLNQWIFFQTKGQNIKGHVRKCQGTAQLGDDVYIIGGLGLRTTISDVWKLNIKTMEWTFLPIRLPFPAFFHAVTITEAGCLYMFGGVHGLKDATRTNKIFKIWLRVPTLKEMCWEAMCLYKDRFRNKMLNELPKMGIPPSLLPRLCPPGTDLKASGNNRVKSFWK